MQKREIYVGFDESNHGKFPEICTAVASYSRRDSMQTSHLPHIRKKGTEKYSKFFSRLEGREYVFLQLSEEDYHRYRKARQELKPLVFASLIKHFEFQGPLLLFVDGILDDCQKEIAEGLIRKVTSLDSQDISIISGKDLDKKIPLVNFADNLSYFLFNNIYKRGMSKKTPLAYKEHEKTLLW